MGSRPTTLVENEEVGTIGQRESSACARPLPFDRFSIWRAGRVPTSSSGFPRKGRPTSASTPSSRRDILGAIIRTIAGEGRTVLFSSHLLGEVERVSDRVAMIKAGHIVFCERSMPLRSRIIE